MSPGGTAVKLPVVPDLNSIREDAISDSVIPSNFTDATVSVAGRLGSFILCGSDAGFAPAALSRMLRVTSPVAVAAGIRLVIFSVFDVMAVHFVPSMLYSIRFDTPVTDSLTVSSEIPVGDVVAAPGTATLLIIDEGAVSVALLRTRTVTAESPIEFRGIAVPAAAVQAAPLSMLNSIAVVTPVIVSVEPLYTAFGAALRVGAVAARVADANAESVAFTRT